MKRLTGERRIPLNPPVPRVIRGLCAALALAIVFLSLSSDGPRQRTAYRANVLPFAFGDVPSQALDDSLAGGIAPPQAFAAPEAAPAATEDPAPPAGEPPAAEGPAPGAAPASPAGTEAPPAQPAQPPQPDPPASQPPQPTPQPPQTQPPAASVSSTPAPDLAGPEGALLSLHQQARADAGLPPFTVDATLTAIARHRAQDMAAKGYFAHTSPSGETAFSLLAAAGYRYSLAAENISRSNYPAAQAAVVAFQSFMSSSAHRANILNGGHHRIGIGYAGAGGWHYFVVVFSN